MELDNHEKDLCQLVVASSHSTPRSQENKTNMFEGEREREREREREKEREFLGASTVSSFRLGNAPFVASGFNINEQFTV